MTDHDKALSEQGNAPEGYVLVPRLCDTTAIDRAWTIYQQRPHCEERFIAAINTYVADATLAAPPSEPPAAPPAPDDEARAIIRGFMGCMELDIDARDKDPETLALETRAVRFLNTPSTTPPAPTTEQSGNSGALAAWCRDAARYFENRPTGGEDAAHWANVINAENARKAAAALEALSARVEAAEARAMEASLATHRQAFCIQQAAAAIGPDASATVEGLPKAVRHVVAHAEAAERQRDEAREALRQARARYVENNDKDALESIINTINKALGDEDY